ETKRQMEHAVPFAMEPVVYDFAINEQGSCAEFLPGDSALMPAEYYRMAVPPLIRAESRLLSPVRRAELDRFTAASRDAAGFSHIIQQLFDDLLPRSQENPGAGAERLDNLLAPPGLA